KTSTQASWASHLSLIASNPDAFYGDNPVKREGSGPGWGCDSLLMARWRSPSGEELREPACVPDYALDPVKYPYGGAFKPTDVSPMPTILDTMDRAGVTWKLYAGGGPDVTDFLSGYHWSTCPTFASCLYTSQANNWVDERAFLRDA